VPAAVWVDGKRLRQVLLNLLSNAVKFTDAGEVWLRVRRLSSSSQDGAMRKVLLRFQVQDTGIGIGPEQLARLFQPFEQLADASRREGGAGLGLAISQQLVQLMGGRIRVERRAEGGSVFGFDLELPVAAGGSVAAPPQALEVGYKGRRRSILVVDDVVQNRAMLIDTLVPLGFEVLSASDGREALAVAGRGRPDLILMDVMMPVMDGLEATRRLRQLAEFESTPIVAVSASAGREEAARACDAGADLLLAKPLQREALLQVIGELLGLSWVREG
jgi:CheY-like chemotaxis protein